jgi:hypothetical protein
MIMYDYGRLCMIMIGELIIDCNEAIVLLRSTMHSPGRTEEYHENSRQTSTGTFRIQDHYNNLLGTYLVDM